MEYSTVFKGAVGVLVVAVLSAAMSLVGCQPAKSVEPTARFIGSDEAMKNFWPLNHCWSWELTRLPKDNYSFVARIAHRQGTMPLAEKTKIASDEATRELSGGGFGGLSPESLVFASVQIVDPSEIGLQTDSPPNLRMVLHHQGPGQAGVAPLSEPFSGRVKACTTIDRPQWDGNELHLMNMVVETDDGWDLYDFLVIRGEQSASP